MTDQSSQGAGVSAEPQLTLDLVNCVRLAGQPETTLVVRLENHGALAATNVEAQAAVTPSSDYTLESWRSPRRLVGRLSPGDKQTLEFTVLPKNPRDPFINVTIVITFSDQRGGNTVRHGLRVPLAKDTTEDVEFKNPYIPGSPLDPRYSRDMFFGRRELIHHIVDNLMGKFSQNILVLHGQRRIGKTSLLLQLRYDCLMPPFYPVFLDMQELPDVGTYLFLHRLTKSIAGTLAEFGVQIETPSRQVILEGGYSAFVEFLDRVATELHGGHLVVIFDEFEELQNRVQNRKIDHDVFSFIRSQMQHRHWITFVFAGTHKLEELSKEYFSIFFNTAIYFEISYLSENEAESLIREPIASFLTYEDRAVKRIKDATSFHPYFIQLICYHLVDRVNREGRNQITFRDVNDAIQEITEGEVGHLDYLWEQSSFQEKATLCGIAELQRAWPRGKHFPEVEILREIENMGEKLTQIEFSHAIESLTARDLVRHHPNSLSYGITFELFSRWIREKHPHVPS